MTDEELQNLIDTAFVYHDDTRNDINNWVFDFTESLNTTVGVVADSEEEARASLSVNSLKAISKSISGDFEPAPSELDILKKALIDKGVINQKDIDDSQASAVDAIGG